MSKQITFSVTIKVETDADLAPHLVSAREEKEYTKILSDLEELVAQHYDIYDTCWYEDETE